MSDDLQRQTHELVTRIDERLEAHCERFSDHAAATDRRLGHLDRAVFGREGLVKSMAVLEDRSAQRKWVWPTLAGAGLSLLAAWILTR